MVCGAQSVGGVTLVVAVAENQNEWWWGAPAVDRFMARWQSAVRGDHGAPRGVASWMASEGVAVNFSLFQGSVHRSRRPRPRQSGPAVRYNHHVCPSAGITQYLSVSTVFRESWRKYYLYNTDILYGGQRSVVVFIIEIIIFLPSVTTVACCISRRPTGNIDGLTNINETVSI